MKKEAPAPIVYPRENGYYLVRWNNVIQPAEYENGKWWLTSTTITFSDHELEIGDKIDCSTLSK